jgi:hypothetical protein
LNNLIESKPKLIIKINFQSTQMMNDEIEREKINKKKIKKNSESTRLTIITHDLGQEIEKKTMMKLKKK